jgi:dnd system-associated protein 4
MASNEPITLNIKKTDFLLYQEIINSSALKGRSNKEVFFLAAVLGYKKGRRISIKGGKKSYVRTEFLNKEDKTLMNALAIKETGNPDIINDQKEVFNIVEEYAHVGLNILKEMVFEKQTGSFLKKFESYLRDCLS